MLHSDIISIAGVTHIFFKDSPRFISMIFIIKYNFKSPVWGFYMQIKNMQSVTQNNNLITNEVQWITKEN